MDDRIQRVCKLSNNKILRMSSNPGVTAKNDPVMELKSSSVTVPLLILYSSNIDSIVSSLKVKIKQAPGFFDGSPLIVDLNNLSSTETKLNLNKLVTDLRSLGLQPLAMKTSSKDYTEQLKTMGFAILRGDQAVPLQPQSTPMQTTKHEAEKRPSTQPEGLAPAETLLMNQPIRSGQQVYAKGGDLIIMSQVSPGAEIMADGNIHIYGTLHGRALAGVSGNDKSRIFCSDLQAEIISIAGNYRVKENLDESHQGKPVQIFLQDQSLVIQDI